LLLSFFVFLMFSKKEGKQQHRETISSSYQPRRILFMSVGIILYIHTHHHHPSKEERKKDSPRKHHRRLKAILKKRRSKRKRNRTYNNKSF
jgi:hypothetical protein